MKTGSAVSAAFAMLAILTLRLLSSFFALDHAFLLQEENTRRIWR